ncbi:MAG: DUF3098 domain-containing protein [Prevotellaceae bacterium]|jgi:membrane-bound ClpP family serine protease|nr:DUF3098 domain-containing protein [Prevotellaceae bacterium]
MSNKTNFALPKKNLVLMGIGFVIIVIGFLLMLGGGILENGAFNPEIFSFRRVTLAPMIALFGFLFEIFAIAWIPKSEKISK